MGGGNQGMQRMPGPRGGGSLGVSPRGHGMMGPGGMVSEHLLCFLSFVLLLTSVITQFSKYFHFGCKGTRYVCITSINLLSSFTSLHDLYQTLPRAHPIDVIY